MPNITSNFSDFSSIQTAYASIGGSFGLASGLTLARSAYDSASYYVGINAVASYSVRNSTQLSGIFNNAAKDNFTFIGTNLLAFPNTATHMDYKFVASGVNVALDGAISTAYSGAGHSGYLNHIDVSSANYGEVTILGYVNVAIGSGTVSSVTRQINGASLTATGQLNASTYLGSDGNYHASISGTLTEMTLSSGGHTLQISGISVDVSGFSGFATADALFNSILSENDTITGTATAGASDVLFGYGGNDTINGGAGTDTVIYSRNMLNYTITKSLTGYTVKDNSGTDGTDTLSNIEKLQFADITIDPTAQSIIAGMYIAVFNRAPDAQGLLFWNQQFTANPAAGLASIAAGFTAHPAFTSTYGSVNNASFVNAIYQNVLGAAGDAGGVSYWNGILQNGTSRANMLAAFVQGSLDIDLTAGSPIANTLSASDLAIAVARQNLLINKVNVGVAFANMLDSYSNLNPTTDVTTVSGLQADPAYQASIAEIRGVTDQASTVTTAMAILTAAAANPTTALASIIANVPSSTSIPASSSGVSITTGFTVSAASDNSNVSFSTSILGGGAAAGYTDSITLGNGTNLIWDFSKAGTVNIVVGSGSNVIWVGGVGGGNTSGQYNIALGIHAANQSDFITVGNAGNSVASTSTAYGVNTVISGLQSNDVVSFTVDQVGKVAFGGTLSTTTYPSLQLALNQLAVLQSAAGPHTAEYAYWGGDTLVIENAGTTLLADTSSIIQLTGIHTFGEIVAGSLVLAS